MVSCRADVLVVVAFDKRPRIASFAAATTTCLRLKLAVVVVVVE